MCTECKCSKCMFWKRNDHTDFISIDNEIYNGECHRYPPQKNGHFNQFPETSENNWCGEFVIGCWEDHLKNEE